MTARINPFEDTLFERLAELLDACSLAISDDGCYGCRHFERCLLWWDGRVCQHCEERDLEQEYFDRFTTEFDRMRNGRNREHGRYSAEPILEIGELLK
jgi:hypothetical protein